ncbi:hypothetical protein [Novosphingobium sp. AAP83]|uniref:hypothetical protein n=1 Tax=Novosphingobium sp. AAP83 TaxID=1523425 RepID=UPI0018D02600|nr:hypothetical protein [Novosphingobium sp. AAP83]
MTTSATRSTLSTLVIAGLLSSISATSAIAQQGAIRAGGTAAIKSATAVSDNLTYADLASLTDSAEVVVRVQVRKVTRLKPEQAPGLKPGQARVLIEARTTALLFGPAMGEAVRYLADIPLDAKGKLPKLVKAQMLIFARNVAGRPGELRLVDGGAQIGWTTGVEARVRAILAELLSAEAAPRIMALREVLFVPGNLADEGETQLFLQTENSAPVSLSVIRRPGMDRTWGVSLSEIVDQAARPPMRDTLTWYRLACFLPRSIPKGAALSGSEQEHRAAEEDYAFVLRELGECSRTRAPVIR